MSPTHWLVRAARIPVRYLESAKRASGNRPLFDAVERYCMFIGYPRSGHTLVGALLDAHPETVVGFEQAAMQHVRFGFDRDRLYQMLLDSALRGGATRWVSGEYRYHVPGQWQGRFERLRVIGDKQAEGATLRIRRWPALLNRLERLVGGPRFIHVIRNPFDNITTIAMRAAGAGRPDLGTATERYFRLCETVRAIGERVAPAHVHTVRHEDFVMDPKQRLADLCGWLRLESSPDYLEACAAIVRSSPHPSRLRLPWDDARKRAVTERMAAFEFLRGYTFGDP